VRRGRRAAATALEKTGAEKSISSPGMAGGGAATAGGGGARTEEPGAGRAGKVAAARAPTRRGGRSNGFPADTSQNALNWSAKGVGGAGRAKGVGGASAPNSAWYTCGLTSGVGVKSKPAQISCADRLGLASWC
jgi:hypothetical protein